MADPVVAAALQSDSSDTVLDALSAVEAHIRSLSRDRAALMEHASAIGIPQTDLARRLDVSQAAISRRLRQWQGTPVDSRSRAILDAVDTYERRQITTAPLTRALIDAGEGPMPALDRAIVRGTVPPQVALDVRAAHEATLSEDEQLERMNPDLLDDLMKTLVEQALTHLRAHEPDPQVRHDLARRARRATDTAARINLIHESRDILTRAGSTVHP